jgi:hypothetical protein
MWHCMMQHSGICDTSPLHPLINGSSHTQALNQFIFLRAKKRHTKVITKVIPHEENAPILATR